MKPRTGRQQSKARAYALRKYKQHGDRCREDINAFVVGFNTGWKLKAKRDKGMVWSARGKVKEAIAWKSSGVQAG